MAFKMKGSAFKLNNVATTSALKQRSMTKKLEKIERPDKSGERREEVEWKETSREKISPTSSAGKKGATHKVTLTSPTGGTKVVYS